MRRWPTARTGSSSPTSCTGWREPKQIGIAPKTPEQASVSLSESQVRRISIASILGLPGLAVLLGVWVWFKRRD
jgi:hypothetical protein